MALLLTLGAGGFATPADPTPIWPGVFSSNFTENFTLAPLQVGIAGFYALDLNFIDPKTKHVGAQVHALTFSSLALLETERLVSYSLIRR